MPEKRELLEDESIAWIIECRTGCSCCSDENHYRGPYSSIEKATEAVKGFRSIPLLASQYSRTGNYNIEEVVMEKISKGRFIINGRIFHEEDNPMDAGCEMYGLMSY